MDDLSFNPDIVSNPNATFSDLNLDNFLIKALSILNFKKPTPIQFFAIPKGLENKNIIAQAKAGTGKTLAFTSILLNRLLLNYSEDNIIKNIDEKNLSDLMETNLIENQSEIKNNNKLETADPDTTRKEQNKQKEVFGLILVPTRELAIQIYNFLNTLLSKIETENKLEVALLIGGLPIQDDILNLKKMRVNIAVGTLGRTIKLIKDGHLKVNSLKCLVFDEADKLLSKENLKEINLIVEKIGIETQRIAFSATFSNQNMEKIKKICFDAEIIKVSEKEEEQEELPNNLNLKRKAKESSLNLINLKQFYICFDEDQDLKKSMMKLKTEKIIELLKKFEYYQTIIFYNTKGRGWDLSTDLKEEGLDNCFIHGDQTQSDRIKIMNKLQLSKTKIIISSDLLSRGIDIATIDMVINFEPPSSLETYFHRIGRTSRYGRFGISISLLTREEKNLFLSTYSKELEIEEFPIDESKILELNAELKKKERRIEKTKGFFEGCKVSEWKNLEEKFLDEEKFKYFDAEENEKKNRKKDALNQKIKSNDEKNQHKNEEEMFECRVCWEFLRNSEKFLDRKFEILKFFKFTE